MKKAQSIKIVQSKKNLIKKRIIHLCLSNWFIKNAGFQENHLVRQHQEDGHTVLVVASKEIQEKNGKIIAAKENYFFTPEKIRVIRVPYFGFAPFFLHRKLRIHLNVMSILTKFSPNIIIFHGTCGWELITASRYVQQNKKCVLNVDSHEDFYNSARSFLSKYILHKIYYKKILQSALKNINKIYCYSLESVEFVKKIYGVSRKKLKLLPLGGIIIPFKEYLHRRQVMRSKYHINSKNLLFVQIGKQTVTKKLQESLLAFHKYAKESQRFIIAGTYEKKVLEKIKDIIHRDPRITMLGWLSQKKVMDLLCAADVYVQPGTQSVTMQQALCCRCAVVLDDVKSHKPYVKQNGWLLNKRTTFKFIFKNANKKAVTKMMRVSFAFAKKHLNYKLLAKKILY